MVERINKSSIEVVNANYSVPPQTDAVRRRKNFSDVVKRTSEAILTGVEAASTVLPGGGLISVAVRGGRAALSASSSNHADSGVITGDDPRRPGSVAGGPGSAMVSDEFSELWRMQAEGRLMNLEFLKIQESMSRENRTFSTLSNVFKARHETARNAINNIR